MEEEEIWIGSFEGENRRMKMNQFLSERISSQQK
jgi:hypothetical protein